MKFNKNLLYYLAAVLIFIVMKIGYTRADNQTLSFLLGPTNQAIEWIAASPSDYVPDTGYYHEKLNILINRSCSGFNFWIIGFIMLCFCMIRSLNQSFQKFLAFPIALIISYLVTLIANISRILLSMISQETGNYFLPRRPHYLIHEMTGIFVYMFFLILIYIGVELILKKLNRSYAKPAQS